MRRCKSHNCRRLALKPLDVYQCRLGATTLCQLRSPDVTGQHIGVAVFVQAADDRRMFRVKPGAGGKLYHAWPNRLGDDGPGQAGSPIVVYPQDSTVCNATLRRVLRVDPECFATSDLGLLTDDTTIELTVQTRLWLIRKQVQGIPADLGTPQPFRRRQPGGMARAIVVAK